MNRSDRAWIHQRSALRPQLRSNQHLVAVSQSFDVRVNPGRFLKTWIAPGMPLARHDAWALTDADAARSKLVQLADEIGFAYPGAAASLREGLGETLTVQRLEITGPLRRTLQSSSPIESMISIARTTSRNVKNWQSGDMGLRWTAAGMLEAEKQFRKVAGYRDLAKLVVAIEHADSAMGESAEEADSLVAI